MNYRSVTDLNRCIVSRLHRLPCHFDLVVGIPRSGLLAANLIALHLNLPMTDLDGYLAGRLISGGVRLRSRERVSNLRSLKALLVDDSMHSGQALSAAKDRIRAAGLERNVLYACVFADPTSVGKVDFYCDICPMPRVFEWNIMHHSHLENSCMDIDGVLCRDPSDQENDDGLNYRHFLETAEPLVVPSVTIGWLVTCRLNKYREPTVQWLNGCNIRYRELIMMDYAAKTARVESGSHASFKASAYGKTDAVLFIESSLPQATEIARLTGRPVFCTENRQMVDPNPGANLTPLIQDLVPLGLYANRMYHRLRHLIKLRTRFRRLVGS